MTAYPDHLKTPVTRLTRSERAQIKVALIGLPIFLAALMGPSAIDRLLNHWGI